MTTFVTIIGGLTVLLSGVGVLLWGWSTVVEKIEIRADKKYRDDLARLRVEIGVRMTQDDFWLTESNDAYVALDQYGNSLIHGRTIDDMRDRWRKAVEKCKPHRTDS